jgi:hypothetical protein
MYFDICTYGLTWRETIRQWRKGAFSSAPLRSLALAGLLVFLPLVFLWNSLWLFLDHLFFPGFRRTKLRDPVFIVGNPRSGTTMMHRLLSRDRTRFFSFKTWEVMFPSILQKKIIQGLARCDRLLGSPLKRGLLALENRLLAGTGTIHPLSLFATEEDESLLVPLFSSFNLIWFFPLSHFSWMCRMDQEASPANRKRIMTAYRSLVLRQAYLKGGRRQFLSKNAFFSGRVDCLYEYFPDCRIIYLVRNPLDVIPSTQSLTERLLRSTAGITADEKIKEDVYDTLKMFYTYTPQRLAKAPEGSRSLIRYEDLVREPRAVVSDLYRRFGFDLSSAYDTILEREEESVREYRSHHRYCIEDYGQTREVILKDLQQVFREFNFDARGPG